MDDASFLLFAYQLPSTPSTHRSYVWRKLKASGALYLQNSVCLLPRDEGRAEGLKALRSEIVARGGEAELLSIQLTDEAERAGIVRRFRGQADDEYGEVMEQCAALHEELARERARAHLTWGELEENEAELAKLRSWLERVVARDFFRSGTRAKAEAALAEASRDLERFGAEVESVELGAGHGEPGHAAGKGASRHEGSAGEARTPGPRILRGIRKKDRGA